MKRFALLALLAACSGTGQARPSKSTPYTTPTPKLATGRASASQASGDGVAPQWDLTGQHLVYMQGPEGARDVVVSGTVFALEGDDVDPTFLPDGRVLFASNRDGDFDLWLLDPSDGAVEQVTNFEGDELQPTVAPVGFGFYAVHNGICGSPASGTAIDTYYKALFTRRTPAAEVWFASIAPRAALPVPVRVSDPIRPSAHATHAGRVSPPGQACDAPSFAQNGLSALFVCDGAVVDATAKYEASFEAALKLVKEPPAFCDDQNVDLEKCLTRLDRRYTQYPGIAVSTPADDVGNPSLSANQTVLLADKDGQPMLRARFLPDAVWKPFELDHTPARNLVWSPTGTEVAFDDGKQIRRANTDFYLQTVRNLDAFAELHSTRESPLLHANRFVVRPADHKEFYTLHDKVRYAERPQFVSTDVALQIFRDEFLRIIENAEKDAQVTIRDLASALMNHFVAAHKKSNEPIDRYFAVVFATGWAPLEAALTMTKVDGEDLMMTRLDPDGTDDETKQRVADLTRPVAARLPGELPRVYPRIPAAIRADVEQHVGRMLRHEGIAELQIPGEPKPRKIDFSQFKIRGAYAENDLGGYFLAMNWFAVMPFPIDPSLTRLTAALQSVRVGQNNETALVAWRRVNDMVGSFMGRPVDATVQQVSDELAHQKTFDANALKKRLLELRGPVPIRDANNEDRAIAVTLFPKRVGLDVTFFNSLTHPRVEGRGWPSSLDVFATIGNERARHHATADAGKAAAAYEAALRELTARTPSPAANDGYWSTDIYHSWLAMLAALAAPYDVPANLALDFARNDAWRDRQLNSALAGYAQLKHSAVLYAMQDMGVECDGGTSYYVAVEQPLVPAPRGFVEPNVAFYDALAALAARTYVDVMRNPKGPNADQWASEEDPHLNVMRFARDLADIARDELAGKPLTDEQRDWIEFIGGRIEQLTIAMFPDSLSFSVGSDERSRRGVAFVTDIHTNTTRQQALHVGVGRIFDLFVVVPNDGPGERLTQGGVLSFYEFPHDMADRLTDTRWGERVANDELPDRPAWTKSFIEPR